MGVLEKLTPEQRPALVRGDCGFGNEPFIAELEERAQPYLVVPEKSTFSPPPSS